MTSYIIARQTEKRKIAKLFPTFRPVCESASFWDRNKIKCSVAVIVGQLGPARIHRRRQGAVSQVCRRRRVGRGPGRSWRTWQSKSDAATWADVRGGSGWDGQREGGAGVWQLLSRNKHFQRDSRHVWSPSLSKVFVRGTFYCAEARLRISRWEDAEVGSGRAGGRPGGGRAERRIYGPTQVSRCEGGGARRRQMIGCGHP